MAMSAEHRSKFAALHMQWWCLNMSEKFSSWTLNSTQTNKQTNMLKHRLPLRHRDRGSPNQFSVGPNKTVLTPTLFRIFISLQLSHAFKSSPDRVFMHTLNDGKLFNLNRLRAKSKTTSALLRYMLFAACWWCHICESHSWRCPASHGQLLQSLCLRSHNQHQENMGQGIPTPSSISIDCTSLY